MTTAMFTVEILPLSQSRGAHACTYYSAVPYTIGAIISVPMRNKEVLGVVSNVCEAREARSSVRTAAYALRKIQRQTPQASLTRTYLEAVIKTAERHAVDPCTLLGKCVPNIFRDLGDRAYVGTADTPHVRGHIVPRVFQGLFDHRCEFYRSTIREAFANGGSIAIVAPTIVDAESLFEMLRGGIERYAFLFHSDCPLATLRTTVRAALAEKHPILIVTTPAFLAIPREDLCTIVVDHEASSAYRTRLHPIIDLRVLAEEYANALDGQLYLADLPLSIESVYCKESGEYEEVVTGHHRFRFDADAKILSQVGIPRPPKQHFRCIGAELRTHIGAAVERGEQVFLYVARRGLSPVTLCGDCGTVVTCRECSASVVLHSGSTENRFLCHSCGATRSARERCVHCNSWRLETLGIGIEQVMRELRTGLPHTTSFELSSDTATTHRSAVRIAAEYATTPASILVGTELALPYVRHTVPVVAVVSLDSLLSLASWNIYERITSTLTRLREIASREFLIQTRHPDTNIFAFALSGNFSGFYRSELAMRKRMGYPPYTTLIKVTVSGVEAHVRATMQEVGDLLAPHQFVVYPQVLKTPENKVQMHGFLRLARATWPDKELIATLQSLPLSAQVTVNPTGVM